ncbi:hypothetical protein ACEWY4_005900 [Coilia grayii]|uniref:Paired domain-containing protein n=1 Tax=Coilia grayii TaxID=363190 RepID=A0ABD1KJS0_9TELE
MLMAFPDTTQLWPYTDTLCTGDNKRPPKKNQNLSDITMPQNMRERAIGMLDAGMSVRVVARQCSVHYSTISRLRQHFRQFGSTASRPHDCRPGSVHAAPPLAGPFQTRHTYSGRDSRAA